MRPRELLIGLTLLVPTLAIGFWPRLAIDVYEATTNGLAERLQATALLATTLQTIALQSTAQIG
jgi:NAD(P)H-quinone oxidoreductase subunit 4